MAEGIPDRNALSSGVFASFAESPANFAVKDFGLRDVQEPQILNRKVRRGLRKGRKGTRNEIRHPFPVRRLLRGYNWLVEFAVRNCRSDEVEALWRIDQQCFEPGISYSRLELISYLRRPGAFGLVVDSSVSGGLPVPVAFIIAEAGTRGSGHIITIDVLPKVRRTGVGSQLLRAAEDRLRAALCHAVVLETAVDNQAALSFYKRHNYTVIKTWPRYYSNGVDAFVLKKDLLSSAEPAKLPQ